MKVALFIDQLVEKDSLTEFANVLLPAFKDVEIYTLAHKPGVIKGNIEQFKIHSTFLSHMVKSKKELRQKSFLGPSALNRLPISCEAELLFVLTEGLCGGLNFCEKTKCYTYVLSLESLSSQGLLEKIFSAYKTKKWKDVLIKSHQLFFSHQELFSFFDKQFRPKPMQVLLPIFPYGDYPLIEEKSEQRHITFLVDHKSDFDVELLELFGADLSLATSVEIEESEQDKLWKRSNCLRSWYQLMLQSKLVVSLSNNYFPWQELRALACGVPVIRLNQSTTPFLRKELVPQFRTLAEVKSYIEKMQFDHKSDRLRDEAVKFNEIRFKSFLKQNIPEIYS